MESRRSLMAKLHIARKDLGLDEDTYRAMLQNLTGKRSSADCTDRQLMMLVAALRKRGWKDSRPKGPKVRPEFAELLKKINALRLETKKPWAYVEAIAKRMYGVGLSWLDGEQLGGVITALVKHQRAQERA